MADDKDFEIQHLNAKALQWRLQKEDFRIQLCYNTFSSLNGEILYPL